MLTDRVEISSQTRKEVLFNYGSGQLFADCPRRGWNKLAFKNVRVSNSRYCAKFDNLPEIFSLVYQSLSVCDNPNSRMTD